MLRILAAVAVAAAILLVATALAGTAVYKKPVQITTLSGPERGALQPVP